MILSFFPPSLSQASIDPESDIKPSDSHECGFRAGIGVPASSARGGHITSSEKLRIHLQWVCILKFDWLSIGHL